MSSPGPAGAETWPAGVLTVGVAVELFMFIFFWAMTAVYVSRANTEFDALTQEIVKQAWKESK